MRLLQGRALLMAGRGLSSRHLQWPCCEWKVCPKSLVPVAFSPYPAPRWQGGPSSISSWILHLVSGQRSSLRLRSPWLSLVGLGWQPALVNGMQSVQYSSHSWEVTPACPVLITGLPSAITLSIFTLLKPARSVNLYVSCCHISFHKLYANNNIQFRGKINLQTGLLRFY